MTQTIGFRGVKINDKTMVGTVASFEIIKKFTDKWIPSYQRDRIQNDKKIRELKDIYNSGGIIDSVKICLTGDLKQKKENDFELTGDFKIIDGLQRLSALKESDAISLDVPVEMYINLDEKEQIRIFKQFNTKATKLTQGDVLKSCSGTLGDYNKKVMAEKITPITFSVRKTKNNMDLQTLARLEYSIYKKLIVKSKTIPASRPSLSKMVSLLDEEIPSKDFALIEKALKNVLSEYKYRFGDYDIETIAYARSYFFAWLTLVIKFFLTEDGEIDYLNFANKVGIVATKSRNSARIKELAAIGTELATLEIYRGLIDLFNHGQKLNKLMK